MTTQIKINAHPASSTNGEPLSVEVSTFDNGVRVNTLFLENGQTYDTVCFEGREIRITESVPMTGGYTFGDALSLLKAGKKVARSGWNGRNMFVFLVSGSTFKVSRAPLLGIYPEGTEINYHAHIDMRTADGQIVPWLASQTDVLAEDWEVVL